MSNSNGFLRKSCRCGIIQVIENFSKDRKSKDGLYPLCKCCRKEYYFKNLDEIKIIMNKIEKEGTHILKSNEKWFVNFRLNSNT